MELTEDALKLYTATLSSIVAKFIDNVRPDAIPGVKYNIQLVFSSSMGVDFNIGGADDYLASYATKETLGLYEHTVFDVSGTPVHVIASCMSLFKLPGGKETYIHLVATQSGYIYDNVVVYDTADYGVPLVKWLIGSSLLNSATVVTNEVEVVKYIDRVVEIEVKKPSYNPLVLGGAFVAGALISKGKTDL